MQRNPQRIVRPLTHLSLGDSLGRALWRTGCVCGWLLGQQAPHIKSSSLCYVSRTRYYHDVGNAKAISKCQQPLYASIVSLHRHVSGHYIVAARRRGRPRLVPPTASITATADSTTPGLYPQAQIQSTIFSRSSCASDSASRFADIPRRPRPIFQY